MRQQVKDFGEEMERILKKNDHKGGWSGETDSYLGAKLLEEVFELMYALNFSPFDVLASCLNYAKLMVGRKGNIRREAVDVANVAMMIWDNNKEIFKDREEL